MDVLALNEVTSSTTGFEVFEENVTPHSNWKALRIRGVFQRADAKNQNGRIYPYSILEQALKECSESLSSKNMFGELDHPSGSDALVSLKNVSHVITKLSFYNKDLIGEAIVFDDPGPAGTPAGRLLGALIRNGCTVGISSRGLGAVKQGYDGVSVVEEYKLVTFDCVHNPSTQQAYIHAVNENKDINSLAKAEFERIARVKDLYSTFSTLIKEIKQ